MSLQIVYRKKNYVISRFKDEYIIYNSKYDFNNYHTHIKNYKTAKYVIDIAIKERIPMDINLYLLESAARISSNKEYKQRVYSFIEMKNNKPIKKYININKGTVKRRIK